MKTTANQNKRNRSSTLKALGAFFGVERTRDPAKADAQVALLLSTLLRESEDLPTAPLLSDAERGRLMGILCPHADFVVHETASALLDSPELYPDLPGVGATLLEGQRRCDRLWLLETFLFTAAQRCRDARCAEQGKLLKDAMAVADHVTHAAALRLPGLDHEARRLEIAIAGRALHQQRARAIARRRASGARKAALRGSASTQQK